MATDGLYERPGFLLRHTHQISVSIFERACASLPLNPAQSGVLVSLLQRLTYALKREARSSFVPID